MARPTSESLTERESDIMNALWGLEAATAEEIRLALPDKPHDSTVRTFLRVLENKGYVRHESRGKQFVYHPIVNRTQAQKSALRRMVGRLFGGSAQDVVIRLVEDEQLTKDELDSLRKSAGKAKPAAAPKKGKK